MPHETRIPAEIEILALDSVFDTGARRGLTVPPRSSIADMVALAYSGSSMHVRRDIVVATIDGQVVPAEAWPSVRPKLGTTVILKPVPQGDVLRNVLLIAVTVAAVAAGQYYGVALANSLVFGAGAAGSGALGSVASAAITATTPHIGCAVLSILRT